MFTDSLAGLTGYAAYCVMNPEIFLRRYIKQRAADIQAKPRQICCGTAQKVKVADAVSHKILTGDLVGGKSHLQKGRGRVTNLENIIKKQELSNGDLETANALLNDLKNALGGK